MTPTIQLGGPLGSIIYIVKGDGCKVLKDHFTCVHSVTDMHIMPIAPLPEKITLKEREELEDVWML